MIVLSDFEVNHFKNIRHAHLRNLNHINILIGSNNCGKTNMLAAIGKLTSIDPNSQSKPTCPTCISIVSSGSNWFFGYAWSLEKGDIFENRERPNLIFQFNEDYLSESKDYTEAKEKLPSYIKALAVPALISATLPPLPQAILDDQKRKQDYLQHIRENGNRICLDSSKGATFLHGTILNRQMVARVNNEILNCPEERLQTYKQKSIVNYVKDKDLDAAELKKVMDYVKTIIDSELTTYTSTTLNYLRGPNKFSTPIPDQGSGVRSVICLICDIISGRNNRIVLIDEPELGLNPAAKREFIKFLKENASGKQVFIATHDPTFVNPKWWDEEKLSIYLFSIVNKEFVKIDLGQNNQDPNVFGGYLPHTTCLKDFHLFVEGCLDVYIHQIFMRKFLEKCMEDITPEKEHANHSFSRILNRIEIYHLGGDFWPHLLHTIPQRPYRALLVFDGDKRDTVRETINRFNENRLGNLPIFAFGTDINFADRTDNAIPVYSLSKDRIEEYLEPKPTNKAKGPEIAQYMDAVPDEFTKIYLEIAKIIYPEIFGKISRLQI